MRAHIWPRQRNVAMACVAGGISMAPTRASSRGVMADCGQRIVMVSGVLTLRINVAISVIWRNGSVWQCGWRVAVVAASAAIMQWRSNDVWL